LSPQNNWRTALCRKLLVTLCWPVGAAFSVADDEDPLLFDSTGDDSDSDGDDHKAFAAPSLMALGQRSKIWLPPPQLIEAPAQSSGRAHNTDGTGEMAIQGDELFVAQEVLLDALASDDAPRSERPSSINSHDLQTLGLSSTIPSSFAFLP
jgi:hypothetical protein